MVTLKPINKKEAALYLGYGKNEPDPVILNLMDECEGPLQEACHPSFCYGIFDVQMCSEERVVLSECDLELTGKDIGKLLSGCEKAVLFAATLGSGVDTLMRKLQVGNMPKAILTDAMAGAAIEQICNDFQEELAVQFPNMKQTMRYSPGYGDLPLAIQGKLLETLSAGKRIGLNVTEGNMLTPLKSVTAVIGLRDITKEEERSRLKDMMDSDAVINAELSVGDCSREACAGCAFAAKCHKNDNR
ncbi:MAG: methionine synthase [Lachnospiraceae bacterium]|nr:methionine synthase [Lachnospiraceae bacterium]